MKILEICHFSAGVCGVWSRVREESVRLSNLGHEVRVFSSNFVKGSKETAQSSENLGKVKISRFPATHLGGESFMHWDFTREALNFNPDVIMVHNFRQLHNTKALSIASQLRKKGSRVKIFLVTHAPFVEGNITRSFLAKLAVNIYDLLIAPSALKKFDSIITISHWEEPYLLNLGVPENKIRYIPNGIPEEFFTQKKSKEEKKILFLGRIAPKKKLETLVEAIPLLKDKKVKVEIVGPAEEDYLAKIKSLIAQFNVADRIIFSPPIYDIKNKISKLDSARIFVLPSRVEGMPQSLIEAMARGKIVIGSDSIAIRDLIKNDKNGYLFEFDNPRSLADVLDLALLNENKSLQNQAKKDVSHFSWPIIIKQIDSLINS